MGVQKTTAARFEISVKTVYVPAESKPDQSYFFFAYRIQIKNLGDRPAQLLTRHWVVTDGFGRSEDVRGPGVVGQQPQIAPGQSFEYESACPLPTASGSMKGTYEMKGDDGESFTVQIPEFYLIAPTALH